MFEVEHVGIFFMGMWVGIGICTIAFLTAIRTRDKANKAIDDCCSAGNRSYSKSQTVKPKRRGFQIRNSL